MRQLVLATKNLGKIAEFDRLLNQFASDIKVLGLSDYPDMPEVEETGKTLSENARLKAKAISHFTNLPALADDSGLFIDALNGQPGIYSARFSGYEGTDSGQRDLANINKVLELLKDVPEPKRGAQFKAVVAFYKPNIDGSFLEKEELGVLAGEIISRAQGDGGFGYDPIFSPNDFDQTLAELSPRVKDEVSHRGIALRAIAPFLRDHL
ncbi:MAG: RdgB/HAM1 family non-canonical purine NTP pyrophosphatase [Actinobacteria bacterium]|jgi:XTP/dITP diphosphohydrolase|uniref:dITP/XTP pyrophosphatase n=1 Tax=freshwater metagenome TaxID=449393 RepID=A0A6J7U472_9ZZZZ|nr:RdgB/HAM1 family non-canonical purine NTP pyrophosphatase [Actinomycetota bacterium]